MFDVIYSPLLNTLLCVGIAIMVFANYNNVFRNKNTGGTGFFILWLFMTVFAMFYCPEYGDTYNGALDLSEYVANGTKGHYEDFYYLPLKFLPHNYYAWRFFVWGIAAFFLVMCYYKLHCSSQYATVIFLTITLIPCFYYLRNCLGFALLYYSVILLCGFSLKSRKGWRTLIVALLLLGLSVFMHNSMPVYYLVVFLALICPFNYVTVVASIILFPILHRYMPDLASTFLSQNFISEETSELGFGYLSRDNSFNYNLNGFLLLILQFLPFFIVYFSAMKNMKEDENDYKVKKIFFQISYLLVYVAFCFYQTASNHLFLRFINTCTLPIALVLVFYLTDKRKTQLNKYVIGSLTFYYIAYIFSVVL